MDEFEVEVRVEADQTLLRLSGDLDMASAPDLILAANTAVARPELTSLAVDLAEVQFLDSVGINALVRVRNLCESRRVHFRLDNPSARAAKTIRLVGLAAMFGFSENHPPPSA